MSVRFLREGQTYSAKADPIAKLMLGLMGNVTEFERSIVKGASGRGDRPHQGTRCVQGAG